MLAIVVALGLAATYPGDSLQSGAAHPAAPPLSSSRDTARRDSVAAPAQTYNGRAGEITVRVPRIASEVEVDGTLTAPAWDQAAVLTGFSQYLPVDGPPAVDSTQVLVWYSPTAIYFGVRAFEAHGAVHATLANRDKIDGDDNVQLILTPFIHGRHALVIAVNPFGVQEDGTITEGVTNTGFGASSQTGPPPIDLSADFVYESKGHLTPAGYEVVIRIPFRSIKYQSTDPQNWGLNIVRKVQHTGEMDTWVPTALAAASFLAQSGTLVGLTGLERGLVLDANPIVTERVVGNPPLVVGSPWHYGVERPQFGGNARWAMTNNLTLNATYRPDFAEVESDATQVVFDPRQAIQYPEKRPFFLDGIEQFNAPNNLIYTRQILAPIEATKLTGSVSGLNVAVLNALDDEGSRSVGGFGHPMFNILRVQGDLGESSQLGAVLTDKEDGGSYNRVAGIDARFTWAKIYSLALQAAGSGERSLLPPNIGEPDTSRLGTGSGPLWEAHFIRGGRSFGLNYDVLGIDPEFVPGSGFVSRNGVVNVNLDHRYTWYTPPESFLETFSVDVLGVGIWQYRHLTAAERPEDIKLHFTGTVTLRGGWQLQAGIFVEHFGYDSSLYTTYYLGHVVGSDTTFTHFVGTNNIPNTDNLLSLTTPQFSQFYATLTYVSGRDENFYEWSSADIGFTSLTVDWRPTNKLRSEFTYTAQLYHRHSDGSLVGRTLIPRLDVEYQLSRPIFFRLVGQYDAAYQDNLRDDSRTNLPIYTFDPASGVYTRAATFTTNQFVASALFSYQPTPGTVAFVGYGNNLSEPESFHFVTLRRTADSFFVKFSYLFRL